MASDVKVIFYANYVTTAEDFPEEAGVQHEYYKEIEVPHENFYEVHRILTKSLGASYCSKQHKFTMSSKCEIMQAFEKIIHLLV